MRLADDANTALGPGLGICRLLNGLWQMSGYHGPIDPDAAVETMLAHHAAGLTTWDLADHYGPAEDLIGRFQERLGAAHGPDELRNVQALTKWVPPPGPMTRSVVQAAVERSRARMRVECIDALQFHWWDYDDERYLDALGQLRQLQHEGAIRHLALTNFDTPHLDRILQAGIPVVSNQVQYSLIDMRPETQMAPLCVERGVHLLNYGTLCGGLLTDRFLGRPEPGRAQLDTASLQKYKPMIDAWGGWDLFQALLRVLREIANKHGVDIANVATRAILDRPAVAGVIVGVRLGLSDNLEANLRTFGFGLDDDDWDRIRGVQGRSRDLYAIIGDCGDEYRR